MAKKNRLDALGFNDDGSVSRPLAPLGPLVDQETSSMGFTTPHEANPTAAQVPTQSAQYGEGHIWGSSQQDHIARNQDGWDQFANFAAQVGISTLGSTLEGAANILDVESHLKALKGESDDFGNAFSDTFREWKEQAKEAVPVYMSKENEAFNPGSAEWWAGNGGDAIGQVLGLLIPAAGVAKIGKLAGMGKAGRVISATVASRLSENTLEANQVFQQQYESLKAQGVEDEVARIRAGEAATTTYNANWVFAIPDLLQFSTILKGTKSVSKGSIGKSITEYLTTGASEAAEEGGQFTVSEEAARLAQDSNADFFGEGFSARLQDYVDDDEFKASVLLGAVGGVVFKGAGSLMEGGDKTAKTRDKIQKVLTQSLAKERANYKNDLGTSGAIDNQILAQKLTDGINTGKLNDLVEELEDAKKRQDLEPDVRATLDNQISDTKFMIDQQAQLKSKSIPSEYHKPILFTNLEMLQQSRMAKSLGDSLTKDIDGLVKDGFLGSANTQIKRTQLELEGYRRLASTQPQYATKVAQLQAQLNTQMANEPAFIVVPELLSTPKDDELITKAFEIVSANEKGLVLKKEAADLQTKTGQDAYRATLAAKTARESVDKILNDPNASAIQINALLQSGAISPELVQKLNEKLATTIRNEKIEKQQRTAADLNDTFLPEDFTPGVELPLDTTPEAMLATPEEVELPADVLPSDELPGEYFPEEEVTLPADDLVLPQDATEDVPALPDPNEVPAEILPDVDLPSELPQEPEKLSKEESDEIMNRLEMESPGPRRKTRELSDKKLQAQAKIERAGIPAWLAQKWPNGEIVLYTNNKTGKRGPATEVFAVDTTTGQLLANTPIVGVGTEVTLKVVNDFPWTVTAGYAPKPGVEDSYVINVYMDGIERPIDQIPQPDNPRYKDDHQLVAQIRALRSAVIASGSFRTKVVGKSLGSFRNTSITKQVDILENDYVQDSTGKWVMTRTPYNPPLGIIHYNGELSAPNVGGMRGMPIEVARDIEDSDKHESSKDLSFLRGKVVTFRTNPNGTKRITGLQARKINAAEYNHVLESLKAAKGVEDVLNLKDLVYFPAHTAGVYSSSEGLPDLLGLSKTRLHVIKTGKNIGDIAIPTKQGSWLLVDIRQFPLLLNKQPFSFKIMNTEGIRSSTIVNHPEQTTISDLVQNILKNQYHNIHEDYLNLEIGYPDPLDPAVTYPTFYDYLKAKQVIATNLAGSKTIGYGEDSSYSFDQAAVYIDPVPVAATVKVTEDKVTVTPTKPVPPPADQKPAASKDLDEVRKRLGKPKLKIAAKEGFRMIGEKEFDWFDSHIPREFLDVVPLIDRFIADNGQVAFGQYYNSIVKLADYAPEGTLYHEAFHFMFDPQNRVVSKTERKKILQDTAKVYNLKGVDSESLKMQIAEEKLAEAFETYKLTGQIKVPKAKGFFQRLWDLIRGVIGMKHPIEKLFREIDNTVITTERMMEIMRRSPSVDPILEPRLKKLPGFEYVADQQEAIEAFSGEVVRLAHEASRAQDVDVSKLLTDSKTLDDLITSVKTFFDNDRKRIDAISTELGDEDFFRQYAYKAMGLGPEATGSFEDIKNPAGGATDGFKTKVIKDLARYGFLVSLEEEEATELKEADESERVYDVDHTLVDVSKSLSHAVRLFLSSIPEPGAKPTIFGTTKFLNFRRVDSMLKLKLKDSVDVLERLTTLAETDPYSKVILDRLIDEKNKGNERVYKEFLSKYDLDGYYKKTVVIESKKVALRPDQRDPLNPDAAYATQFFAKLMDADRGSADRTVFNRWRESGVNKKMTDSSGEVNLGKAQALKRRLETYKNKYYDAKEIKKRLEYNDVLKEFRSILRDIGTELPEQLIEAWGDQEAKVKNARLESMFFGQRKPSLEQLIIDMTKGDDPYKSQSGVLGQLARESGAYIEGGQGGGYRNEEGNVEFPINLPSYLTESFKKARQITKEFTSKFEVDRAYEGNKFLAAVKSAPTGVNLNFTSAIRTNQQDPKGFSRRGRVDSLIMRLTSFFNNSHGTTSGDAWYFLGTAADKTKQPIVSLRKYDGPVARNFLKDVLLDITNAEIIRMVRLKETERKAGNPLPSDIATLASNNKFLYISAMNSIPGLADSLLDGEIDSRQFLAANKQVGAVIDTHINQMWEQFLNYMADQGLVTITPTKTGRDIMATSKFPKVLYEKIGPVKLMEDFFYNDTAWRIAMSHVFMGDRAFYSTDEDYFKRAYQGVTPGLKGAESKKITRAVYPKQIKEATDEEIDKLATLVGKPIANMYRKVNKTDAQSLITIHGYRTIAKEINQWPKEADILYDLAWSKNMTVRQAITEGLQSNMITPERAEELRKIAARVVLQPFKPFQYNDRTITLADGSSMIVKEQFKDSITPIIPELGVVHPGYQDLNSYMIANKIDIMSAADTVKVGSYGILDLSQPAQDWQKREIDLSDIRFPQAVSDKRKEIISGTQLHKLILGDIDPKHDYAGITGEELIAQVNSAWTEKIKKSSASVAASVGTGEDFIIPEDKEKRNKQMLTFKQTLQQEMLNRDVNDNYLDAIELVQSPSGDLEFTLPVSFPALSRKFQQLITNLWKKKVLKQKSVGYSSINLADFGVGYVEELKFMQKDGDSVYSEIGLPIDYLKDVGLRYGKHILPNGRIIWSELDEFQKQALEFIVYRIPTSNKSSMLPVRVAVITPAALNNIVLVPGEMTIQQGMDFDVDKSQLIMRVLKGGKIDESHPDTKLFNLYQKVLTNKAHYKAMATPLEATRIDAVLRDYRATGVLTTESKYPFYTIMADVEAEIKNKDAKAEIGIASRFNTGHAVVQTILPYVSSGVSIGIATAKPGGYSKLGESTDGIGVLISENFGETQQAALDAAKTPRLPDLNVVRGNMAAFESMIAFGVPLKVASDFFSQPIIGEWVKFYDQEGQNDQNAFQKLYQAYPGVYEAARKLASADIKLSPKALESNLQIAPGSDPNHEGQVLKQYNLLVALGRRMGNINNALSIDTFGAMADLETFMATKQSLDSITNPASDLYIDARVFNIKSAPPESKRLAAFYHYGIDNALTFVNQYFPNLSGPYQKVSETFSELTGREIDADTLKRLNQFLDFYLLAHNGIISKLMTEVNPTKTHTKYRWSYFDPENSIWDYISDLRDRFPALEENELIKNLESTKTTPDRVVMIGIRNTDDVTNKSQAINGWYELLNASNPEIKQMGHDLVRYAVFTAGMQYGPKSMFDLIPVSYWVDSGVAAAWTSIADGIDSLQIDPAAPVLSFIRHHFANLDSFPEWYGSWGNKGYRSKFIGNVKTEAQFETDGNPKHIVSFTVDKAAYGSAKPPKYVRLMDEDLNAYRLYESNPQNEYEFRELQPLGENHAYTEAGPTGREASSHPRNQNLKASPDPWAAPKTQQYNAAVNRWRVSTNVRDFLPEDINSVDVVLNNLRDYMTDVDSREIIDNLTRNLSKISGVKIELGDLEVEGVHPDDFVPAALVVEQMEGGGAWGRIVVNKDRQVAEKSELARVLLHEINHAMTVGVLNNPLTPREIDFERNTIRLMEDARTKKGADKHAYYLKDKFEFQAHLASSKEFRSWLRGDEGLWRRIIRHLRKLLGVTDKYDQYLNQLYDVLDSAIVLDEYGSSKTYGVAPQEVNAKKRISALTQAISSLKARKKRYAQMGHRVKSKHVGETVAKLDELAKINTAAAIAEYLKEVEEEVLQLKNNFHNMNKNVDKLNPEVLLGMREQLASYSVLPTMSRMIRSKPKAYTPPGITESVYISSIDTMINDVRVLIGQTKDLATRRFAAVIMNTVSDPSMTFDKIVDQLEVADRDVDFINRWMQTGMDTNDPAIQTAAKLLKANDDKAYRAIQEDLYNTKEEKVSALIPTLEHDITTDKYSWQIRSVDYIKVSFEKALTEYEKWKGTGGSFADKFAPIIDQEKTNEKDTDGIYLISPFSTRGQEIMSIPKTSKDYPLRQFYETFVLGYYKSQENIPSFGMRPGARIPSIMRSTLEGVLAEKGADKFHVIKEAAIDAVRKRFDETDFKAVDETGKPQEYVPVRYIAKQDGSNGRLSKREVSLDLATTLPLFIHEMYALKGLHNLRPDLELGKTVLEEREVMKTTRTDGAGLTPLLSSERDGIALDSGKYETIKGSESNSFRYFSDVLKRFLYGEYKQDEGDLKIGGKKFSVSKMVDSALKLTGFKMLFGNLAVPVTNAVVGEITMMKEVVGGNLINLSDYKAGKRLFSKAAMPAMKDLGQRTKKTKFGRIYDFFNLHDMRHGINDLGVSTNVVKTLAEKVYRSGGSIAEFYLSSTTLGATLNRFKAVDPSGKEVSLYDAIDVNKGGLVDLLPGYTYKGKKSISQEDVTEIKEYGLRVYQLMNGVYNRNDKAPMNQYVAGRLLGFMRNWLKPGLDTRWRTKFYDERLKSVNEGHYVSALIGYNNFFTRGGAMQGVIDTLRMSMWLGTRDPQLLLLPNELNLDPQEQEDIIKMRQANVRKTLFELWMVAATSLLLAFGWDDDDDDSYLAYLTARVRRELSTFYSPTTAWDVLRTPTVALDLVESSFKIAGDAARAVGAVATGNDLERYERGPGKGQTKLGYDTGKFFGLGFLTQFDELDSKTRLIKQGYR